MLAGEPREGPRARGAQTKLCRSALHCCVHLSCLRCSMLGTEYVWQALGSCVALARELGNARGKGIAQTLADV